VLWLYFQLGARESSRARSLLDLCRPCAPRSARAAVVPQIRRASRWLGASGQTCTARGMVGRNLSCRRRRKRICSPDGQAASSTARVNRQHATSERQRPLARSFPRIAEFVGTHVDRSSTRRHFSVAQINNRFTAGRMYLGGFLDTLN
jgi:hypothetical protein